MSHTPRKLMQKDWENLRHSPAVAQALGRTFGDRTDLDASVSGALKFTINPKSGPKNRCDVFLLWGDVFGSLVLVRDAARIVPLFGRRIFVTVSGGVAEVDDETVPPGVAVEIIDLDGLEADEDAVKRLSPEALAYAQAHRLIA